jgi:hypothetical protein
MIFYGVRKKIRKWFMENYHFYKTIVFTQFIPTQKKVVYIEIDEVALNRYLYNFIKFFILNDYTVYIPKNKKVIDTLNRKSGEFSYGSWILQEKIRLGKPKQADLVILKDQLSNDYFTQNRKNSFYVPMSEYPGIYKKGLFEMKSEFEINRKRSVFMSGNLDIAYYKNLSKNGFFNIPSRSEVAQFLKRQTYYHYIEDLNKLKSYINGELDHRVIIIDNSQDFRIPLNELKEILQCFHFYLALPGISIPQSHNLIEAMSVGCIPVIHKTYADLMDPVLENMKTAIIYESLAELNGLIPELFNLEISEIKKLHENVKEYFGNSLSPKAVVSSIEEKAFSKIYIQAENRSLYLLNQRKNKSTNGGSK